MCGIVGAIGHDIREDELKNGIRALHHRGPDGSGFFLDRDRRVGLGHARLSVIDLETGAQPLYAANDDYVLVCNGEIYDYPRIRKELISRGHRFATKSDSEVILHLYHEHGLAFVDHLRGEFAFLLLDKTRHKLLAVRDRFGIKPLFFNRQAGKYLFASEAKAMFATGRLSPRMDVRAIYDYLRGVVPDSIFEGVETVPPGTFLEVDLRTGQHHVRRYWDLNLPAESDFEPKDDMGSRVSCVREAVEEAVRLRLRADVPVGVYLSGGVDSSVVATVAAREKGGKLDAFSITFPEHPDYDESRFSRNTADRLGINQHTVACDHRSLIENLADCLWISELPAFNLHGVAKFLLSRLARGHVKVVLTGEGADEVFMGYADFSGADGTKNPSSTAVKLALYESHHTGTAMPFAARITELAARKRVRRLFHADTQEILAKQNFIERLAKRIDHEQIARRSKLRQMQCLNIKSNMTPYILTTLGDRAEMGHSIEGRTPFLDHHLFGRAAVIPDQFKVRSGVGKAILREAFKDDLNQEIYLRNKVNFQAPPVTLARGISKQIDSMIDAHLSPEAINRAGIFNYRAVEHRLKRAKSSHSSTDGMRLGRLSMLVLTVQILNFLFIEDFHGRLSAKRA